jgi:hypothetical protein
MSNLSIFPEAARTSIYSSSRYNNAYVLAAGVAQTITVPTGYRVLAFSSTGNFFADFNGATAIVPSTSITNGTADVLNPTVRLVEPGQTISIIAPSNCIVTVSFYVQE